MSVENRSFDLLADKLKPIFNKMKVLLVDDMPENIEIYRSMMVDLGVEKGNIASAQNGLSALAMINSVHPDLVLTDWNMPVVDGLQFAKKMRDLKSHKDLLIVMITAEQDSKIEEVRPYVNAFLRKPVTVQTMEQMMVSIVAKRATDPLHPLSSYG